MTQTPTNPELDKPDELVELFKDYHIIKYENVGTSETDWYELYESVRALLEKEALKARDDENSTIHRWVQKPDNYDELTPLEQTKWVIMTLGKIGSWLDARHADLEEQLGSK